MNCRICGIHSPALLAARVMFKHGFRRFACMGRGFVQTEDSFRSEKACASPISAADAMLVQSAR